MNAIRSDSCSLPRGESSPPASDRRALARAGPALSILASAWLAAMALVPSVRAHDPFDIWTMVVVRPDHLELAVTMSRATAMRLIDPEMKLRALTANTFAVHRPRLEREAAALHLLTAARHRLEPIKVAAELTDENDVVFHVAYPRPPPGRLDFAAAFLQQLGRGYGGILDVSTADGRHLGWEQLSFENPAFAVTLPPSTPAAR